MGRVSFFTMLADDNMSWIEQGAINSAHDRADAAMEVAQVQGDAFGKAISSMQRRLVEQSQQIKLLSAAVGVLAAMLRDNGAVNGEVLDARLEAAMMNAEEEIAVEANTITCLKCSRQVLKTQTVMTELGVMCDRCHAIG